MKLAMKDKLGNYKWLALSFAAILILFGLILSIYISMTNDISLMASIKNVFIYFLKDRTLMEKVFITGLLIGLGNAFFIPINILLFLTALYLPGYHSFAAGMLGALIAAILGYCYGLILNTGKINEKLGRKFTIISKEIANDGLKTVIMLCFAPIAPNTITNILAGICKIRVWKLLLGTFIGFLPGITLLTLFGRKVRLLFEEPGVQALIWAIVVLGFLLLSVKIGLRIKNKMMNGTSQPNN